MSFFLEKSLILQENSKEKGEYNSELLIKTTKNTKMPKYEDESFTSQKSVQKERYPRNQSNFYENETSVQEKILRLYDIIERKTITNISLKKSNEILEGQIEAYNSIIRKMEANSHLTNTSKVPHGENCGKKGHRKSNSTNQSNSYDTKNSNKSDMFNSSKVCETNDVNNSRVFNNSENKTSRTKKSVNFIDSTLDKENDSFEPNMKEESRAKISRQTSLAMCPSPTASSQCNSFLYVSPRGHKKSNSSSDVSRFYRKKIEDLDIETIWNSIPINSNTNEKMYHGSNKNTKEFLKIGRNKNTRY